MYTHTSTHNSMSSSQRSRQELQRNSGTANIKRKAKKTLTAETKDVTVHLISVTLKQLSCHVHHLLQWFHLYIQTQYSFLQIFYFHCLFNFQSLWP